MGIKKLDVKAQQLCSDGVKGDIEESLCRLTGEQPAEESPAHAQDGNLCITGTPQTLKNFPGPGTEFTSLGWCIFPECFCRVYLLEPPRHVLELRAELSHLAELSTRLPDCNNYRFQGHVH